MFNPSTAGFHPFGNPNHQKQQQHTISGAPPTQQQTTPHLNVGVQQGIIGHNSSPSSIMMNNNRKSLLDSLHQQQQPNNNNITPNSSLSSPTAATNGMMNGFQSSLFYTNTNHNVNSNNNNNNNNSILGGNNLIPGMNYSHFVQPHTNNNTNNNSLLNLSQQQPISTNNPHNDGFQLLGNNKLFSHSPNNNNNNLASNLLRNNNNLSNSNLTNTNSNSFGLSLLGSSTTEPIGTRNHVMNAPPMGNMVNNGLVNNNLGNNSFNNGLTGNLNTGGSGLHGGLVNNLNNPSSSLLSSFHNDFGNRAFQQQQQQQFNNLNLSMGNTNSALGWNNNIGGGNNLVGFNTTTGNNGLGVSNSASGGLMNNNPNGGQLLMNNQIAGGSNASFYSPFLSMNPNSGSPSMGQQSHLPLFGSGTTTNPTGTGVTTSAHNDFFSNSSGQFGGFSHQQGLHQQQPIGRNKSSNEVDFSYLTSSLPLDDDDNSFLPNQTTTNPLFEDQSFKKAMQPPLFNAQQQTFAGFSPSSSHSSGNNSTNDNTTATPSPPPPQFLSSAPEYHNRVLAMASTQYSNPPQQSPTNTNFSNFGSSGLASMISYNNFPSNTNNAPFVQPNRGNIPPSGSLNESLVNQQPFIPMNGKVEKDIKQTGNGYQYVFAPPPATNTTHINNQATNTSILENKPKKEATETKTLVNTPEINSTTPSDKSKESAKKKPEPQPVSQKSKSKKKNDKSKAAQEVKPLVETPKLEKEEKSEQEKLDEELAKKLQREFELEYLRNLDTSSKSKNNSFTTSSSGKKKKILDEIPDKIPLASSSTQSNSFSVLESVPVEIQSNEKTTKKQPQTQQFLPKIPRKIRTRRRMNQHHNLKRKRKLKNLNLRKWKRLKPKLKLKLKRRIITNLVEITLKENVNLDLEFAHTHTTDHSISSINRNILTNFLHSPHQRAKRRKL